MRVLLLLQEFPFWHRARHWSYSVQLGIEEGLLSNQVDLVTIVAPWLQRVETLCKGKKFDQVWIELVHSALSDGLLERIAEMAPVRIGLLGESLEYTHDECLISKAFEPRKRNVHKRLKYVTHVLAVDEYDASDLNRSGDLRALWWPQAVPRRWISENCPASGQSKAIFSGSVYGSRSQWLSDPSLSRVLMRQPSSEKGTMYPVLFDLLQLVSRCYPPIGFCEERVFSKYMRVLRFIRQECFGRWIASLQSGVAVVNLPSMVKAYAGRVVEGMAAGRPVITWEVPNRPRNLALFEDGKEILLYRHDRPDELVCQMERLTRDANRVDKIVNAARLKIKRLHTMEHRVKQILKWIDDGECPCYE